MEHLDLGRARTPQGPRGASVGAVVASVNTGRVRETRWAALGRTAMAKTPVAGPVHAGRLGLDGDEVFDRVHHGGPDRAVSAYAREDLDRWADALGAGLPDRVGPVQG